MRSLLIGIAIMASLLTIVSSTAITAAPLLFGRQANNDLYNCDGLSKFWCPQSLGTCYTGGNGYIGCCTAESCAPRTTCVPFTDLSRSACDQDTGGCLNCSNRNAPNCVTITNIVEDEFIMYCDAGPAAIQTTSYTNPRKTAPASTTASTTRSSTSKSTSTSESTSDAETSAATTRHHGDSTASPTSTPTSAPAEDEDQGKPATFYVAIVLGVVLGSAFLFIVGWFIWRRRQRNRSDSPSPSQLTGGPAPRDKDGSPISPDLIQYSNAEINEFGPATPAKDVPMNFHGPGLVAGAGGKWTGGYTKLSKNSPPGSGVSTALASPTGVPRELDGAAIARGNSLYEMEAYGRTPRTPVAELNDDGSLPIHREEILAAIAHAEANDQNKNKHLSSRSLFQASPAMSTPSSVGQAQMPSTTGKGHKQSSSGRWMTTVDDNGVPTIGMALPGSSLVSPTTGTPQGMIISPTTGTLPQTTYTGTKTLTSSVSDRTITDLRPTPLDFNRHSFTHNSSNAAAANTSLSLNSLNSDGVSQPGTASTTSFSQHFVSPEPNTGAFPHSESQVSQSQLDPAKWPAPPKIKQVQGMSATGWGDNGYVSPEIALRDGIDGSYKPYRPGA